MNVNDVLVELKKLARTDSGVRERLLATKDSDKPLDEFCRISTECGFPLSPIDVITAGEDDYAAMKRSTNGGGENSPRLDGADDYYEMFLAEI